MAADPTTEQHSLVTREDAIDDRVGGFCDWTVAGYRYGFDVEPTPDGGVTLVLTEINIQTTRRRTITAPASADITRAIKEALDG